MGPSRTSSGDNAANRAAIALAGGVEVVEVVREALRAHPIAVGVQQIGRETLRRLMNLSAL